MGRLAEPRERLPAPVRERARRSPPARRALRRRRRGRARQPDLPAAAERLVEQNQVGGHAPLRLGQLILLLGQELLNIEHAIEVGLALIVESLGQIQRLIAPSGAVGQVQHLLLSLEEGDDRILRFGIGLKHGILVLDDQLLEAQRPARGCC